MQPFGRTPASTASMQGDEGVHAISAFVGPVVRSRHSKPCPAYFEISFLENAAQVSSCLLVCYSTAVMVMIDYLFTL